MISDFLKKRTQLAKLCVFEEEKMREQLQICQVDNFLRTKMQSNGKNYLKLLIWFNQSNEMRWNETNAFIG